MNVNMIMNWLLVGFGGSLGAISRYQIGKIINKRAKNSFPIATFIINITGAFLLGIVSGYHLPHHLYSMIADGFLGAFTTFSTFMYEGFTLFAGKEKLNALLYIFSSIVLGIIGFYIGYEAIRALE